MSVITAEKNFCLQASVINVTLHHSIYKFVGVGCENIRAEEMSIFDLFATVYANIPFFQDMRPIYKLFNAFP
jgi:hypothetical protein